jgi:hypothetical protein
MLRTEYIIFVMVDEPAAISIAFFLQKKKKALTVTIRFTVLSSVM